VSGEESAKGADPYAGSRDARGRFQPGNKGSPGRPSKAREAAYVAVLREILSLSEWGFIVRGAILRAQNGDAQARQWLSDYAVGKPTQAIDVRAVEEGEPGLEEQFSHLSDEELVAIVAAARSGSVSGAGREAAGGASGDAGRAGTPGAGASAPD
jgi:hypothetical protein